jgi:hypothetical protein
MMKTEMPMAVRNAWYTARSTLSGSLAPANRATSTLMPMKSELMKMITTMMSCHATPIAALPRYPTRCPTSTWSTMPCRPPITLVSIVGQASFHTAGPSGPSMMERS